MKKSTLPRKILRFFVYLLVIGASLTFITPFFWMVATSLKSDAQIFASPPVWFPWPPHWENYTLAAKEIPIFQYLLNTLFITVTATAFVVIASSLAAYGFSKIHWRGRDKLFFVLLATMMLPAQVTMIPQFVLFDKLGWVGSFKPLIVPSLFGSAFFIFLLRQFFLSLPAELSDAAKIDGCSEFGIFTNIVAPLAKPAILTCVFFSFVAHWNDFMGPLIYLTDDSMYTLSIGLQQYMGLYQQQWSHLMAISTVMVLPVLVFFLALQRTLVKSLVLSGIKG